MKKSFTLIELIVVIAIIAVLAAIIAPNAFRAIEKAKIAKGISDLKAFKAAILSLYADTGHWVLDDRAMNDYYWADEGNGDLHRDYSNWTGWDGPYIENSGATPWGGRVVIAFNGDIDSNGISDLRVEMDNWCYGASTDGGCGVPVNARNKIDAAIDDGNLSNGNIRNLTMATQEDTLFLVIEWDYR